MTEQNSTADQNTIDFQSQFGKPYKRGYNPNFPLAQCSDEVDAGMNYYDRVKPTPVSDANSLAGLRIAIISGDMPEEIEALFPLQFFTDRGAQVSVIAPDWIADKKDKNGKPKGLQMGQFQRPTLFLPVSLPLSQAKVDDFDCFFVPGGAWNPIILFNSDAPAFIRQAYEKDKLVAAVCHGPLLFIHAGIIQGKRMTAVNDIRPLLTIAGAVVPMTKEAEDQPAAAVQDGNLITARNPFDLVPLCLAIEKYLLAMKK